MKTAMKIALSAVLAITSASVIAAPHLTPQECNDYPFTPLKAEVTHAQLLKELAELESVGYNPAEDDEDYPSNLEIAQAKLQKEYRRDCATAGNVAGSPNSNAAAAPLPTDSPAS